jgi:hypothetical protein
VDRRPSNQGTAGPCRNTVLGRACRASGAATAQFLWFRSPSSWCERLLKEAGRSSGLLFIVTTPLHERLSTSRTATTNLQYLPRRRRDPAAHASEPHQTRNRGFATAPADIPRTASVSSKQPLAQVHATQLCLGENPFPMARLHPPAPAQWPREKFFEYIARIGDDRLRDSEAVGVAARNAFLEISPNPGPQPHSLRTPRPQIQIQAQACCLRRRVGQAAAVDTSSSNDVHDLDLRSINCDLQHAKEMA